jgi:hypothetical protein
VGPGAAPGRARNTNRPSGPERLAARRQRRRAPFLGASRQGHEGNSSEAQTAAREAASGLLHDLEQATGNPQAAAQARRQAIKSYRRIGVMAGRIKAVLRSSVLL